MSGVVVHYTTEAATEVLVPEALRAGLGEIAKTSKGIGLKVNVKRHNYYASALITGVSLRRPSSPMVVMSGFVPPTP